MNTSTQKLELPKYTRHSCAMCYLGGDLVESEDGKDPTVADAGGALDCVRVQALHRLVQPGAVVEVEPGEV